MPKRIFQNIKMTIEQPDCCALCPLLGAVPPEEHPYGSKETFVCIATCEAMSERATKVCKSKRDSHHPWHRPCDDLWDVWYEAGKGFYPMKREFYIRYRLPVNKNQQMVIKFHNR